MKKFLAFVFVSLLAAAPVSAAEDSTFKSDQEKNSYALGQQLGKDLKKGGVTIDSAMVAAGIKDALAGTSRMDEAEIAAAMEGLQKEMMQAQMAAREEMAAENTKKGKEFLEANAKKKGVTTTKSGLQYEVIEKGKGKTPGANDKVTVHYRGTLIDGTEFDSSYQRGNPATFPVSGVIPGWTEALQLMKEGAKYKLVIPSELAYGERGAGQVIGPNAPLVFDVELIKVEPADKK